MVKDEESIRLSRVIIDEATVSFPSEGKLALAAGMSSATLSRVRCRAGSLTLVTILKLAKARGMRASELVRLAEERLEKQP